MSKNQRARAFPRRPPRDVASLIWASPQQGGASAKCFVTRLGSKYPREPLPSAQDWTTDMEAFPPTRIDGAYAEHHDPHANPEVLTLARSSAHVRLLESASVGSLGRLRRLALNAIAVEGHRYTRKDFLRSRIADAQRWQGSSAVRSTLGQSGSFGIRDASDGL